MALLTTSQSPRRPRNHKQHWTTTEPDQNVILPRHLWVSNKHRSSCVWCVKPFSLFRHRHHCRLCGDLFCKDCVVVCKTRQASVKVCRSCMPSIDAAPPPPRRRTTLENVKLLDTARCLELSSSTAASPKPCFPNTATSSTCSLPNSPSASELGMAVLPSPSMVATLAHLLQETADTHVTLAAHTSNATQAISAHDAQIDRLNRAIARIEAKLWHECADPQDVDALVARRAAP
ncbi:hypothetical protein H310_14831 [Aphanomyces invadans]|uniref:FYVE-type domain-containing protein n=1 Tax=Aphanomyces invadans TaxID=157072 RepID=A0A024TAN9_9STRA|nr:hypothetical protein H310_14831 [Aphanomyces invadans]ETV90377.1 hypothetical protein H310_14831 [Aphanomyces invadans]|eukprot:XP_008880987.1 hypothetical protein H310_14831 [Aphanomyces invadans]